MVPGIVPLVVPLMMDGEMASGSDGSMGRHYWQTRVNPSPATDSGALFDIILRRRKHSHWLSITVNEWAGICRPHPLNAPPIPEPSVRLNRGGTAPLCSNSNCVGPNGPSIGQSISNPAPVHSDETISS